jgi:hypothetical protein
MACVVDHLAFAFGARAIHSLVVFFTEIASNFELRGRGHSRLLRRSITSALMIQHHSVRDLRHNWRFQTSNQAGVLSPANEFSKFVRVLRCLLFQVAAVKRSIPEQESVRITKNEDQPQCQ